MNISDYKYWRILKVVFSFIQIYLQIILHIQIRVIILWCTESSAAAVIRTRGLFRLPRLYFH